MKPTLHEKRAKKTTRRKQNSRTISQDKGQTLRRVAKSLSGRSSGRKEKRAWGVKKERENANAMWRKMLRIMTLKTENSSTKQSHSLNSTGGHDRENGQRNNRRKTMT